MRSILQSWPLGWMIANLTNYCETEATNKLTLIIWANLTVSLDGQQTANSLFVKMLDHIYVVSPLSPSASPIKSSVKGAQL